MQNGFGYLGILITIAIIALMAWGAFSYSDSQKKNQIEVGQDAIKQAEDAASTQNQYNQSVNGDLENPNGPEVKYDSIRKSLDNIK